jgi:hypothetical protein
MILGQVFDHHLQDRNDGWVDSSERNFMALTEVARRWHDAAIFSPGPKLGPHNSARMALFLTAIETQGPEVGRARRGAARSSLSSWLRSAVIPLESQTARWLSLPMQTSVVILNNGGHLV